jgi:serine/threonine protein kinase/Tol biopolymer transport system component
MQIELPHMREHAGQFIRVRSMSDDSPTAPSRPSIEPAVPLPIAGTRLGRYELIGLLGAGGMGQVFRAVDASLGREVAIKALGQAFRDDSESLRRFEREARVLATLNHPNIATIYGFERLDGAPFLILERVDGETLAQRLARGSIPLKEATAIALQVIAGLEEAHSKGVIHRDLKPSNVMLTREGRVKLVDFGLAKTASPAARPREPSEAITVVGLILGTAPYMSPEQLTASEVDARTDVWAFGCVLYEMLTRRRAFPGSSVSEAVAAVLRDDPDWHSLPTDMPSNIVRVLRRCLRRDPHDRLQHIGDARLELEETESAVDVPRTTHSKWKIATLLLSLATLVLASVSTLVLMRSAGRATDSPAARLSLELPAGMTLGNEYSAPFAIAPSGSPLIVEAGEGSAQRLYVRELGDPMLRALPGTDGAHQPFVSPDGKWVAFLANRKLSKVPIAGGPIVQLADIGDNPRGAAWAPDGTIVIAPTQTSGLARVSDHGGKPTPLTMLDSSRGEYSHRWPDVLPGGQWVIFTVGLEDATFDEGRIEAVSMQTGERRVLITNGGFARYASTGELLFVRGGQLHAVGFDLDRVSVSGTPEVVLDTVRYDPRNGGTHLAVSSSGVLLYGSAAPLSSEYYLTWVDREGRLDRAVETPRPFRDLNVSPDGSRVAVVVGTSTESDLWLVEANGTLSRLSLQISPHRPAWTPDGRAITVGAQRDGTWRLLTIPADAKDNPTVLLESANRLYPNAWSADGRTLIFQEHRPDAGWDLEVLAVDAAGRAVGTPQAFANSAFHETSAAISADGRWIAYESDEVDGVVQVYVRSFPGGDHKVRASTGGARWPAWDSEGSLYYWQTGENRLQRVRTRQEGARLIVDAPEPVWSGPIGDAVLSRVMISVAGARYDVVPHGSRFLVLEASGRDSMPDFRQPQIVVGAAKSAKDWFGRQAQPSP